MSNRITKPNDIRWPGIEGLPRLIEDINANFDALFRTLERAGIQTSGVISPPGGTGGGGTGDPGGLSDPVTEPHGGTGKTTYNKGDLLVGLANHKLDRLAVGADGKVLKVTSGTPAWGDATHEVLSATHTDTETATVVRGDIITGQGATAKWKRLAKGALNYVLRMGANEPEWADPAHNVLSATHTDATAAAAVRGDIITGQGASPKWTRLAKSGTSTHVLTAGANEPTWAEESDPKFALTKRYGFVDNTETSIACAAVGDGTYRVTLTCVGATFRYFRNGVLCTISGNKTVLLAGTNPPTNGMHYIYIDDESGTLTDGTAWTLLDTKVPVCGILFLGTATPTFWLADERHTCLIDRKMHYYEHISEGTKHISGGAVSGQTVTPTTPSDTDNTLAVSQAIIMDEDLTHTLTAISDGDGTTATYYIFYRTGVSSWAWEQLAMPYRWTTSGYIQWDNGGTMTQGQANRFYNSYLLYTNVSGGGFIFIPGTGEYTTLAAAQAESPATFTFTGLGIAEFVLAYQFTWGTNASYSTKGKCRLAATPKHVDVSVISAAVASMTADHNSLAGLQGGASSEYYHLTAAEYAIAVNPLHDHRLDQHLPATAAVDFNSQQATDLVIQTVANEEAVQNYEDPTAGQMLYSVADQALWLCIEG